MAIHETNIDSSIATSELFPETCQYDVFRKNRHLRGGRVMLLIHKDIPHMTLTELENDSDVLDEILNLIESVSEDFPSYSQNRFGQKYLKIKHYIM